MADAHQFGVAYARENAGHTSLQTTSGYVKSTGEDMAKVHTLRFGKEKVT